MANNETDTGGGPKNRSQIEILDPDSKWGGGKFKCKVSTLMDEDTKVKTMVVYGE